MVPARFRDRLAMGQSLVEFALVLPILLLIVLGAIDLGRVYLMTINMENAAKEGAFFGARNPTCDTDAVASCADPQNVEARVTRELDTVASDGVTAACYAAGTTDFSGAGKALASCLDGDLYRVTVNATFRLVTPVMGDIVGDSLALSSTATSVVLTSFAQSGNPINPLPTGTPRPTTAPGDCTVPDFRNGTRLSGAQAVWETSAGFTTTVDTIGPGGQAIVWQSLPPGTVGPCATLLISVSNTAQATPSPTPTPTPTPMPTPPPSPTPTPDPTPTPSPTPTPTPTPPVCVVPQMVFSGSNARKVTEAQGLWTGAGFRAANFTAQRPPDTDYKVKNQSIAAGASRPCLTTSITVDNN
jgi:Flp pilus assembly protein TadG